jgi:uncharacterized protein YndB with AHSA1/START domain
VPEPNKPRGETGVHPDDKEFVLSRTFDAPRDLVWKAWTEPKRLMEWWGPKGFKMKVAKLDLKPGGTFLYAMNAPDGSEMWGRFVFREIKAPERLEFINSFSNERGEITRHPMHEKWPLETLSIIEFAERGGKTTITVRWIPINATTEERKTFADNHASMNQGWGGTMDQLAAYLGKAQA